MELGNYIINLSCEENNYCKFFTEKGLELKSVKSYLYFYGRPPFSLDHIPDLERFVKNKDLTPDLITYLFMYVPFPTFFSGKKGTDNSKKGKNTTYSQNYINFHLLNPPL